MCVPSHINPFLLNVFTVLDKMLIKCIILNENVAFVDKEENLCLNNKKLCALLK